MKKYDVIVLGFGKAGKTLAAKLATQGKSVAMVEEDDKMYGGNMYQHWMYSDKNAFSIS